MRFPPTPRASVLSFALLAALAAPSEAPAQSITAWPAVVPLEGTFGQSVTQSLTLRNDSDIPLDFTMEAQDVVVRDGVRAFVEAGALPDSIAASAVFQPRALRVDARATATVTVTLTLPAAMQHRAVVTVFRGTTPISTGDRAAFLSLGTLFTFTVSGDVSVSAEALHAEPPSAAANARIHGTLLNDGSEPVAPAGVAVLLDAGGHLVGKASFPERRLLPGESTTVTAEYPGELPPGTYRAVATFDFAGRALTLSGALIVP